MGTREELEKDVNAAIKQVLSEMEIAARQRPEDACHPYACEQRRKVVMRVIWHVYRRTMALTTPGLGSTESTEVDG